MSVDSLGRWSSGTPALTRWLRLPTLRISPFLTYHMVSSSARIRVTRSDKASTTPVVSPTTTSSPTPYWSSKNKKMPERKSLTRLCAPNPRATPTSPALATSGPMS